METRRICHLDLVPLVRTRVQRGHEVKESCISSAEKCRNASKRRSPLSLSLLSSEGIPRPPRTLFQVMPVVESVPRMRLPCVYLVRAIAGHGRIPAGSLRGLFLICVAFWACPARCFYRTHELDFLIPGSQSPAPSSEPAPSAAAGACMSWVVFSFVSSQKPKRDGV